MYNDIILMLSVLLYKHAIYYARLQGHNIDITKRIEKIELII